jgi:hypothetical protein
MIGYSGVAQYAKVMRRQMPPRHHGLKTLLKLVALDQHQVRPRRPVSGGLVEGSHYALAQPGVTAIVNVSDSTAVVG